MNEDLAISIIQHPLVRIFLAYFGLLAATALYALLVFLLIRNRPRKVAVCPQCGRTERMKPYINDSAVLSRTTNLLYCGGIPGLVYYIWNSRLYLCPHCRKVTSPRYLRRRPHSSGSRRRRHSSSDTVTDDGNG